MAQAQATPLIRAVLFDFDGLILDTETPDFASWQQVFAKHGADLPLAEWAKGIGRGNGEIAWNPYDALEAHVGRPLDRDEIRGRRRHRFAELLAREVAMAGVDQLLQDARALRLSVGIASSSPRSWVEGFLRQLGLLARFDEILCREDVALTKPDPELYVRLLSALRVAPSEAIALEDSPNGVAAAKGAGIYCIAVPNRITGLLCFDHADRRIDSLLDLHLAEYCAATHAP